MAASRCRLAAGLLAFAVLIVLALPAPVLAQQNPFGAPRTELAQPPGPGPAVKPSMAARFWTWVRDTQRSLHRRLAGAVRQLKQDGGLAAGWLLAGLSFFYGVVHAAGPGHGKAVISSYVLANEKTMRRGIALSFLASAVQALSAVVLVAVLAVLLNAAGFRIKEMTGHLETASYGLIALVGAWLVFRHARRFAGASPAQGHAHAHDHAHDHHNDHNGDHTCCGHAHMPGAEAVQKATDWKSAAAIVFAVGVRPCTGAIVVLVFALANGLFLAGVGATFAMALGTAITVSALAMLAVGSRELALKLAGPGSRLSGAIFNIAGLGGSVLVLLIGSILFASSLTGPARPF